MKAIGFAIAAAVVFDAKLVSGSNEQHHRRQHTGGRNILQTEREQAAEPFDRAAFENDPANRDTGGHQDDHLGGQGASDPVEPHATGDQHGDRTAQRGNRDRYRSDARRNHRACHDRQGKRCFGRAPRFLCPVDGDSVVHRPLETLMIETSWHKGRIALLGDAVHATTPHLGQGAGMAIEDSLVMAEELARRNDIETALTAYHDRRIDRCAYSVRSSVAICMGRIGKGPPLDNAHATHEMSERVARPT